MNRWLIASLMGVFTALGAYLFVSLRQMPPESEMVLEPPAEISTTPPRLPAPVILAQVVETTDIDPLLDPPSRPIAGLPFDDEPIPATGTEPARPAPDSIPLAKDD